MNLIEALKTGKRIRRSSWETYMDWCLVCDGVTFSKEEVLADDWEVKTPKRELDANDFLKVVKSLIDDENLYSHKERYVLKVFVNQLIDELGLK
jgi:hypothetical protein